MPSTLSPTLQPRSRPARATPAACIHPPRDGERPRTRHDQVRLLDVERILAIPPLSRDLQNIAEPFSRDRGDHRAAPLDQSVCRQCGAMYNVVPCTKPVTSPPITPRLSQHQPRTLQRTPRRIVGGGRRFGSGQTSDVPAIKTVSVKVPPMSMPRRRALGAGMCVSQNGRAGRVQCLSARTGSVRGCRFARPDHSPFRGAGSKGWTRGTRAGT